MNFSFNYEQEMLRDMVRVALQKEVGINVVRTISEKADASEFDNFLIRNGWGGIGAHEEMGGQGGGLIEQAILFEELGRAAAPIGTLLAEWGAVLGIASSSREALEALAPIVFGAGRVVLGVSASRPIDDGGTQVTQVDGKLTGKVSLVLNAGCATDYIFPIADNQGIGLWLVNAASPGLSIVPRKLIDHTRQFGDVVLSSATGKCIGHISLLEATKANARVAVLIAAASLGLARRMLEMTVDYVGQRVQFGVPVGSFQAVKHSAAEALVDIEATHAGVYYAAWALDEGESDGPIHAWIAKSFGTEAAVRTADRALQLHGAIGYTWEYDLQLYYKQAKVNLEIFGSPKVYRERISDELSMVE